MLVKTKGIVLKSIKYSETSVICDIYTEELGLQSYIFSGVRAKKSQTGMALLQPSSIVEMVAYHNEQKKLNRTKEIKVHYVYEKVPFDFKKGVIALYLVELLQKTIKEREQNKNLYNFIEENLVFLDKSNYSFANLHLFFTVQLSGYLGFQLNMEENKKNVIFDLREGTFSTFIPTHTDFLDEEQSNILINILSTTLENCHEIELSRFQRQELLKKLLRFYQLHIEGFQELNSPSILQSVFE